MLQIPSALQHFHFIYKKRFKSTDGTDGLIPPQTDNSEWKVEDRLKQSVNHCMMMGYSGSKYSGMQYQTTKDIVTIEGMVFKAMLESNWIDYASYKQPKRIRYQEGSRTDKGVSATRQCCSILLRNCLV